MNNEERQVFKNLLNACKRLELFASGFEDDATQEPLSVPYMLSRARFAIDQAHSLLSPPAMMVETQNAKPQGLTEATDVLRELLEASDFDVQQELTGEALDCLRRAQIAARKVIKKLSKQVS